MLAARLAVNNFVLRDREGEISDAGKRQWALPANIGTPVGSTATVAILPERQARLAHHEQGTKHRSFRRVVGAFSVAGSGVFRRFP